MKIRLSGVSTRLALFAGMITLSGLNLPGFTLSDIAHAKENKPGQIKILCLGDSITQADINRASYRYPLWKKLIDANIEFDFVGSMNTHLARFSNGVPPQPDYRGQSFDPDHEGHYAWEASDIAYGRQANNGTGSGSLSQWLQDYDFDIALVHIGTNDAFYRQSNSQVAKEITAVIEALRQDNPKAIILLAKVIPTSRTKGDQKAIENLNQLIPILVSQLNSSTSPVILVDQFSGFDANTQTYDSIHPNELGEEQIAQRWFDAIIASLPLMR